MPATRRTKGVVLAPVYDDPMPRKPRSRATSVASSQRSEDARSARHERHEPVPVAFSRLASHNEELLEENQDLRQELERQKSKRWTLRDRQLAEQLAEHHAKNEDEKEQEQSSTAEQDTHSQVARIPGTPASRPAAANKSPPGTANHRTISIPLAGSPQTPATVPRWKQLWNTIGSFSPFSAKKSTPKEEQAESPLRPLPQNRKRPAPPAEPDLEQPTQKRTRTPEHTETQQPPQSTSKPLDTISEQAEKPEAAEQTTKAKKKQPSTPTRKPKRKKQAQSEKPPRTAPIAESIEPADIPDMPLTETKRRTLSSVRAERALRERMLAKSVGPVKTFDQLHKLREPNADKRLARLQQIQQLRAEQERVAAEIARLNAEQEADGIDTRKRKRVKVDDLAYIPHNQPGDALSTFRVPDWDSDDEMEVDDDVPVRQNMFALNLEKEQSENTNKPVELFRSSTIAPKAITKPQTQESASKPDAPVSSFKPPAPTVEDVPPTTKTSAPAFTPSAPSMFKPTAPAVSKPAEQAPAAAAPITKSKINWPSVGPKAQVEPWSDERKNLAGQKFATGFAAWVAAG